MKTLPLLAGLTATFLGLTGPAQAQYEFDQEHQQLEATIEHLMEVNLDDPACETDPYAGWISKDGIVVCTANSRDFEDFQDTLRHEGVHLAQACSAYTSGASVRYLPLHQSFVDAGWNKFAFVIIDYPDEVKDVEAEAWYVASLDKPKIVDNMIRIHCSFAF